MLIIGGGLMGLSLAHQLARKGITVNVLSRSRTEAAGFVAAGMLAPHAEGLTGDLLRLGQLSLNRIPEWVSSIESDSGISCGLRFCGVVVPFETSNERDAFPTAASGLPLTRDGLDREVQGLGLRWKHGLLFPQDGQIDNRRRLMRALEKACVGLGVQFQEGIEVLELVHERQVFAGVKIRSAEGRLETICSQKAVLCGGAWSGQIFKKLPMFPVKGQMLSLQGPKDALNRIIFGPGIYLVPREDGLVVVGATSEREAAFSQGLTPDGQTSLQDGIRELLPAASLWPPMERWWGFRPCTPDALPVLGSSSIRGLWLATGHHRNGVLLAAITSKLLASLIVCEDLPDEEKKLIKAFSFNRFES